ncbi:MAG: acetoacetate--CoA ligase [Flavobacteriales bacterium]|nr:acetoacetate--CoA ligase [Flavobacteriales bacterium]
MENLDNNDQKLHWSPSAKVVSESNIQDYLIWLEQDYKYFFEDYNELWEWSVSANDEFWESIMEYYRVLFHGKYKNVTSEDQMPFVSWFDGIKLSYTEHVFRNYTDDRPAIIYKSEGGELYELSWQELVEKVASLRQFMLDLGIKKGDVVAAYLPNVVEASISFFAVNSIGAIWSSTSPDFGINSVVERFDQIEPKLLIASESYSYNGKVHDRKTEIKDLQSRISSIKFSIVLSENEELWNSESSCTWNKTQESEAEELAFERVEFSHPIWVLYSSGTTGAPKAITHGTGGVLIEHLKYLGLHNNVKKGDRFFWFTTTGWMMWNYLHASMLHGSIIVLYDGSPAYPDMYALWALIETAEINHFGIGASFISSSMKADLHPNQNFDYSSLKSIGSTGSPLSIEGFDWIYKEVKEDVWISSISGGTDVCSAFVGGNLLRSVCSGEIQGRALGCDLSVFDDEGKELFDEVGEMVIKKAMPSMPIYFWNDSDYSKYKESYFENYSDVWCHGDWIKLTKRDGIIIYGRSDATLNRGGVRIGTSEIYSALSDIKEVEDAMVIGLDRKKGEYIIPIFLKLKDNIDLDDILIERIKVTIKNNYSPRHIPDVFIKVSEIPYTISGKKMETPFKKILMGVDIEKSIKKGSMKNPDLIDEYVIIMKKHLS